MFLYFVFFLNFCLNFFFNFYLKFFFSKIFLLKLFCWNFFCWNFFLQNFFLNFLFGHFFFFDLWDLRSKNVSHAGSRMTSQMFGPRMWLTWGPEWPLGCSVHNLTQAGSRTTFQILVYPIVHTSKKLVSLNPLFTIKQRPKGAKTTAAFLFFDSSCISVFLYLQYNTIQPRSVQYTTIYASKPGSAYMSSYICIYTL